MQAMDLQEYETAIKAYLSEIADSKPIPKDEEVVLAKRMREGDEEARNKMVESNLLFVVSVAKQYQGRGLPLDELISAGNLGLLKACDRFDERKGIKFISYAVWWIRQAILEAINAARTIRLPANRVDLLRQIFKASSTLQQEMNKFPDEDRIASELDISPSRVREVMLSSRNVYSLDQELCEDGNKLIDLLADENEDSPENSLFQTELEEDIQDVLETLNEKEAQVIRLYFGLNHERKALNLEQIASKLGLTRERIRQIKEISLQKLRHVTRSRKLEPYLMDE